MRLDRITFSSASPHAAPWVPAEETDGFVITRMAVNGQPVNLDSPPPAVGADGGGRGGGAGAPTENTIAGLRTTRATIALLNPIPAAGPRDARGRVEPQGAGRTGRNHRMTQRWARHALPADAVVSARRRVRRPARLGPGALPRPVRVL